MQNQETFVQRARELVAQMTLEEAASQLRFNAPAIERLNIPAYNWWNEALHGVARAGVATMFPQAIAMAATFDTAAVADMGAVVAEEGRAKYNEFTKYDDRDIYKGLTYWAPNVNIFRDPRWGRGHETFGEDPYLTGRMGVAFIRAMQGDGEYLKAAACAKHFAVHSGPESLRHSFNAEVSPQDLWDTYLPAFEECVLEGGVEAVMGAYNRTNGEPCCGSQTLLRKILRDKWNFKGHVVSDCAALKDFHTTHGVTKTAPESAAMALHAGCDVNCGFTYLHLLQAYQDGLVTEEEIREAAVHLFTTRFKLGLFDENCPFNKIPYEVNDCKEHNDLSLKAARESIVLLKNDGILPLDRSKMKTIGVVGPNAASINALIGNYYGTASCYTTNLRGIQELAGEKIRVLYAEGSMLFKDRFTESSALPGDRLSEAASVAAHSDVVILCLGLDATLEGEEGDTGNTFSNGDKNTLLLPDSQRALLQTVVKSGKPVVLVVNSGSALDLRDADAQCNAIVQAWYGGAHGGRAVAEVLFGEVNPSGRLPVTFYRSDDDLPDFTDYSMENRTYRYFNGTPLYPFGFGLSYTRFAYSGMRLTADQIHSGEGVEVTVTVTNAGTRDGEEVVQVYCKDLESSHRVPRFHLCGFARVALKAGESVQVTIPVEGRSFQLVDEEGNRIMEPGKFRIYIGGSLPDERSSQLNGITPLQAEVVVCG